MSTAVATLPQDNPQPRSVLVAMSNRYGMEPQAFEATLRATVVQGQVSREQFAAFLLVAKEYGLNPLTKEIYAFPSRGGIQPIVSVDGWANLINSQPACDGFEFVDNLDDQGNLISITCRIFRKDRSHPVEATEYIAECARNTDTWKQWPRRMLRHKALIQAARYAFGFSGIADPDEGERIRDVTPISPPPAPPPAPPADEAEREREASSAATEHEAHAEPEDITADEVEMVDADKWLDDLDAALSACSDADMLGEVWDAEAGFLIEEGRVFPPDRSRAEDIYQKHLKRVDG